MNLNRFCYLLLTFAAIGSLFTPHPVATWLLLANLLTLLIYGADKMAARKAETMSYKRIYLPSLCLRFSATLTVSAMANAMLADSERKPA